MSDNNLAYIADELVPFQVNFTKSYSLKKVLKTLMSVMIANPCWEILNTFMIKKGSDLVPMFEIFESDPKVEYIEFKWNHDDIYNNYSSLVGLKKNNPIHQTYQILKTFLTFQYHPIPVVQANCRLTLGKFRDNHPKYIWRVNLSLEDTIRLVKSLSAI